MTFKSIAGFIGLALLLARIFHEPMLGEVKRLQVLRGAIFGLPLRRFEAICEFCRHRPQTPG